MTILPATSEAIARAARALRAGAVIGLPTETVYGLAADATRADSVAAIFRIKGRPADHPLIVHVSDLEQAAWWADLDDRARTLGQAFWPGPLTLILRRRPQAAAFACGGEPTIGLRIPSHPVARAVLAELTALGGHGLAAPSANRFGKVSPTRAEHVLDDLGDDVPLILDGGDCPVGVESTIVDLSRPVATLLRPGGVDAADIERVLGMPLAARDAQAPRASGTLAAHYAPHTPLELLTPAALPARAAVLAAMGLRTVCWSVNAPPAGRWLAAPADPATYSHVLYDTLRSLDGFGVDRILVEAPPAGTAWDAVHDRLGRAAATFSESRP
ncbi:MAG TPA: L-threonylcarbamoyladenylate synthase [Burkholderiaceae bacterium]|nr:L-threonylcarbamoyladenylate synthase [Burkholderiaceae bacterium]